MLSMPKAKGGLFLASSLCDGLEDNNIRQVATLLLNKDADPNILIPTHGVTPFHLVIGNDSVEFAEEVTKLFLRHGGNPNVRSNDGMTPVHVAAAWGRINILQLLLANGGDPLRLDNDGRSPFHYAFDGRFFKAITLLSKYCENIQDEDDEPKYNIVLDKVLITNGDLVAEYVTSKNTALDVVNNKPRNDMSSDFYGCTNSSSMIVELDMPNVSNANEIKCKVLNTTEGRNNMYVKTLHSPSMVNDLITAQKNNLSQNDNKNIQNYLFSGLDFDFANRHLSDVMQKEKCLVSKIINQLSMTLTSDCTINETLHNYKKNRQEKSDSTASNSDFSFQQKENVHMPKKYRYRKNPKNSSSKVKNNRNKDILKFNTPDTKDQYPKHGTQSTSRKKCREISSRISLTPTYILDNSIISMSPNFSTPNYKKKKNTIKTPLILSHVYNDSIISKSPNFATPVCTNKNRNMSKISPDDEYFSSKIFRKSHEHKSQVQYSEFNRCKRHIAQSTPRRKRRSIYKLRSFSRKKYFDVYRQEDDATVNELITRKILKPINLDKTIFSETTEDTTDIVNSSLETLSLKLKRIAKIKQQNHYHNHLAIKLDEEKYDKEHDNSTQVDSDNDSFNEIKKKSEFINSFDEGYDVKSENNLMNNSFVTIRKNIFKTDKEASKTTDSLISNNLKYTTECNSLYNDNFVDCVDCNTKKLLNEDLNMNISKTCNFHARYNNRLYEPLSRELAENNSHISIVNLPVQHRQQIYLSDSQRSYLSKMDENNADFKRTENMSSTKDLDVYKIEKSSSVLSYISTQQEYKYEDREKGVILLERRLCITPLNTISDSEYEVKSMVMSEVSSTSASQALPQELLLIDDAVLRKELTQFGDRPGPITSTTRRVYLKRLMHLRSTTNTNIPIASQSHVTKYCIDKQIKPHLELGNWINHLNTYRSLERQVFQEFVSPDPSRRWREGTSKTSFTYLLLDPRITQDLPNRNSNLAESEVWSIFLNAIFYIGKGKRSRPFAHLYDAFNIWVSKSLGTKSECKKINCILDIWNNDHGVICLHIFQNIIPVEAYTREAAMIDAIGTEYLGNCKGGEYYGIAATWSMQQKQKFGRYLLYKALQILLYEGERQVFPQNL